jgi:hypothetical protein
MEAQILQRSVLQNCYSNFWADTPNWAQAGECKIYYSLNVKFTDAFSLLNVITITLGSRSALFTLVGILQAGNDHF